MLRSPVAVTVLAIVIGVLAATRLLAFFEWDPTVFTAFAERLGVDCVWSYEAWGHDAEPFRHLEQICAIAATVSGISQSCMLNERRRMASG